MTLDDENIIKEGFEEFIKIFTTLSLPAEDQMRPETALYTPAEDMESEFETLYTVMLKRFMNHNLINSEHKKLIDDLHLFFNLHQDPYDEDFFVYDAPYVHRDWEIVRIKAKAILNLLR